jgi:hypothetical protein
MTYRRYSFYMEIGGSGYIEVFAKTKEEAVKKVRKGDGRQVLDEWHCETHDLTPEDEGEVDEKEIAAYSKETGETLA